MNAALSSLLCLEADASLSYWVGHYWRVFVAVLTLVLSLIASGHALLYKRDSRSAVSWVGFVWLVPLIGAVLYFILGVNRIQRRAVLLRGGMTRFRAESAEASCPSNQLAQHLTPQTGHLSLLAEIVEKIVARPLLGGNRVTPLCNGDEAYPAMLDAIRHAGRSITFLTYIFDRDEAGLAFADAFGEAERRGVEVRVLIDATGTRYSWPSILGELRHRGVRYARFLPAFPLWRLLSMNLRNHRKILVVDGRVGFTGGMNIRAGNMLKAAPKSPVQDIHFRVEGPVVRQLQEVFADDWLFTTAESLRGDLWFPALETCGEIFARGIPDGPDEDLDKLPWTLLGALSMARTAVRVVTPYFLPDPKLISALSLAAMRCAQVDIVLPARSNLPFVDWASRASWWQLLQRGCRIWLAPPPFDHSKLVVVDDAWSFIGSANWDPRSFRLNFEFNLECYDPGLAQTLNHQIKTKMERARKVTLQEVDARPLPARLRDGVARLLTPYL